MVGGKKLTAGAKLQIMLFYWINITGTQVLYVVSVFIFQSTIFVSLFSNILEGATLHNNVIYYQQIKWSRLSQ